MNVAICPHCQAEIEVVVTSTAASNRNEPFHRPDLEGGSLLGRSLSEQFVKRLYSAIDAVAKEFPCAEVSMISVDQSDIAPFYTNVELLVISYDHDGDPWDERVSVNVLDPLARIVNELRSAAESAGTRKPRKTTSLIELARESLDNQPA